MSEFAIPCPYCRHPNEDPWDVTAQRVLLAMKCDRCSEQFHVLVLLCDRCSEETVLTWPEAPPDADPRRFRCAACGQRLGQDEVSVQTDDPDVW